MRYRRTKRDSNHKAIVDALRVAGCTVVDLAACGGGVPDLLVGVRGRNLLLEIKNPENIKIGGENMTKTRQRQADFRANWTGQAAVVYTIDEALFQISKDCEAR